MKAFLRRAHWDTFDVFAAIVTALVALWIVLPSSVFLRPVGYQLDGAMMTFVRDVPFGQVTATWGTELRTSTLQECHAAGGPTPYQTGAEGARYAVVVRYPLQPQLWPCVDGVWPVVVSQTHQVSAFGGVPLRASESIWICPENGRPCVRSR